MQQHAMELHLKEKLFHKFCFFEIVDSHATMNKTVFFHWNHMKSDLKNKSDGLIHVQLFCY